MSGTSFTRRKEISTKFEKGKSFNQKQDEYDEISIYVYEIPRRMTQDKKGATSLGLVTAQAFHVFLN